MTEAELRQKFTIAYRIIARERAMRDSVFKEGDKRRKTKLAEMDELLAILVDFKDALVPESWNKEQYARIDSALAALSESGEWEPLEDGEYAMQGYSPEQTYTLTISYSGAVLQAWANTPPREINEIGIDGYRLCRYARG